MAHLPVRRDGVERRGTQPAEEPARMRADPFFEVDIAVTGDRLTISGHLYDPRACSYARFTRGFTLPQTHSGDRSIRAALDGGVLTVTSSSLPGDDSLARWESEGGLVR